MPVARPKDWKAPPVNPELDAYKKWKEHMSQRTGGGRALDDRDRRWQQWEKDRHSPEFKDYIDYKKPEPSPRTRDERDDKWDKFEVDTFGGKQEVGSGSGEGGKFTLEDLYIKTENKRFEDRQRDLFIDPKKKKQQDQQTGGGGGSRKSGGKDKTKTGGPGNPNTGGSGGGSINL